MKELTTILISDSTGETAQNYIKSVTSQFPDLKVNLIRKPSIDTTEEIDEVMDQADSNCIVVQTIANEDLSKHLRAVAKEKNIEVLDILNYGIRKVEEATGLKAVREIGLTRTLSEDYFNMIEAIEFAIQYDDGKDPRGFPLSDIVLVGVSRTSKTPTTMILATKNFKVSNLPLVPEIKLPREIFEVDPERIIGLVIDPDKLSNIREVRSKSLGIVGESIYYDDTRIRRELEYAQEVFKDLDCKVIDVTENTIEQTATDIVQYYFEKFPEERRKHVQ
ncbi:MAG: kinase/pyrophosphorylase [Anaerococcus sp.]|uniref:pyruvate, water dikinase regulatory protein n=1 Tax=Anaerococcus sp. TaxID=1872515 RepID=UPI0026259EE3|nr:pyruvate, water dikinase regulatory protein [Anaerococcus sp.]MCI5971892.1 kinase/pyrophosphorylase [Anaerococcus sp.]MDD6918372.1 kinase/pyrophosphorylase [Peptoniphilaceae bacterium]MDY2927404.1 pyruvate, water dikinase regulatory protein [Anaerococcus sp.]